MPEYDGETGDTITSARLNAGVVPTVEGVTVNITRDESVVDELVRDATNDGAIALEDYATDVALPYAQPPDPNPQGFVYGTAAHTHPANPDRPQTQFYRSEKPLTVGDIVEEEDGEIVKVGSRYAHRAMGIVVEVIDDKVMVRLLGAAVTKPKPEPDKALRNCTNCDKRLHTPEMYFALNRKERRAYAKMCEKEGVKQQFLCCDCKGRMLGNRPVGPHRYGFPNVVETRIAGIGYQYDYGPNRIMISDESIMLNTDRQLFLDWIERIGYTPPPTIEPPLDLAMAETRHFAADEAPLDLNVFEPARVETLHYFVDEANQFMNAGEIIEPPAVARITDLPNHQTSQINGMTWCTACQCYVDENHGPR